MKRFHGWEPSTRYEYEGERLVSSVPDVEWDEGEQTVMLALQHYRATLCPLCGGPLAICTAPENEMKYDGGLPVRCHATTARGRASEPYKDQPGAQALMFIPKLRE